MRSLLLIIICLPIFARVNSSKTICSYDDDRIESFDRRIAKLTKKINDRAGCTMTLIGNDCAISAGHCLNYIKYAQFNVPHANNDGNFPQAQEEDIYEIDQSSITTGKRKKFSNQDWAVFKLLPNRITGESATQLYGYYEVTFSIPWFSGDAIIKGYGKHRYNSQESYIQKEHSGKITKVDKGSGRISYIIDTTGGNSGSAVILQRSDEVVAIHTKGGCSGTSGSNSGVLIPGNKELIQVIRKCLNK